MRTHRINKAKLKKLSAPIEAGLAPSPLLRVFGRQ
jgi:hypothetical protein